MAACLPRRPLLCRAYSEQSYSGFLSLDGEYVRHGRRVCLSSPWTAAGVFKFAYPADWEHSSVGMTAPLSTPDGLFITDASTGTVYEITAAAPEPASFGLGATALLAGWQLRRRKARA